MPSEESWDVHVRNRALRVCASGLAIVTISLMVAEAASRLTFELFTGTQLQHWRSAGRGEAFDTVSGQIAEMARKPPQSLFRFHPYVGYTGTPGQHPWGPGAPGFNRFGLLDVHGGEYPSKRDDGEFILGVFGGSVAEIFANNGQNDMAAYFAERLGNQRRLRLVNLAVAGFKQPQQLFSLQWALLSGFEFDAVVNIDGFNDVALATENIDAGLDPAFPSGRHTALMAQFSRPELGLAVIRNIAAVDENRRRRLEILRTGELSWLQHSALLDLLSAVRVRVLAAEATRLDYDLGAQAQAGLAEEFRGPRNNSDVTLDDLVRLWAQASAWTAAIADKNNLVYLHVLQPNQYPPGAKKMGPEERRVAIDPANAWGQTAVTAYPLLSAAGLQLKADGVNFLDLSYAFANESEPFYVDNCCHFNVAGNRVMGQHIVDAIIELTNDGDRL